MPSPLKSQMSARGRGAGHLGVQQAGDAGALDVSWTVERIGADHSAAVDQLGRTNRVEAFLDERVAVGRGQAAVRTPGCGRQEEAGDQATRHSRLRGEVFSVPRRGRCTQVYLRFRRITTVEPR